MGHPNGAVVPVDEPAVAARADHFAAGGGLAGGLYAGAVVGPYGYGAGYGAGYGYGLVAHPNGAVVPVDEPAVQAARADHFAAQEAVYAAAGPVVAGPVAVGGVYAHAAQLPTAMVAPS